MKAFLLSERLSLQAPRDTDVDDLLRIHGDLRTYAHHPAGLMRDRAEAEGLLTSWQEHWHEHGFGYAVVRRRGGQDREMEAADVLGFAGLKWHRVLGHRVLNLYYRFAPQAWGRGYAREAATTLVAWATREHPEVPVLARVALSNPASQRVAEAAGFVVVPDRGPGRRQGPPSAALPALVTTPSQVVDSSTVDLLAMARIRTVEVRRT